jgi:FlaA1/EpsC-like NDP-sugar epimerase
VIPFFLKQKEKGFLPITHPGMTRYNITLDEGVNMVLFALANMWGGEIFVPRIPSYRILDVAEAIAPGMEKRIVGIRPGEKIHEEMITETDAISTIEFEKHFVILPSFQPAWNIDEFRSHFKGSFCKEGFRYNSGENSDYLSVEQLRNLIQSAAIKY